MNIHPGVLGGARNVLALAALKGYFPGGTSNLLGVLSDGVVTGETTRAAFITGANGIPANTMVVDYINSLKDSGEASGPNSIDVTCVLEYGGLNYAGGVQTLAANAIFSPSIANPYIPPYTRFDVRSFVSVGAGQKWPVGRFFSNQRNIANQAGTEFGEGSNRSGYIGAVAPAGSDQSTGTSYTAVTLSGGNGFGFAPLQVRSLIPASSPRGIIFGTSIEAGSGDNPRVWPTRDGGWAANLLAGKNLPFMSVARSGDVVANWISSHSRQMSAINLTKATFAIVGGPTNDFTGATTDAVNKANMLSLCSDLKASGDGNVKVWVATTMPRTNAGNTAPTTAPFEVKRLSYNNWLRDGAPINASIVAQAIGSAGAGIYRAGDAIHPFYSYLEVADVVESARDSGLWNALYAPADGIHPGNVAVVAVVAALASFNP